MRAYPRKIARRAAGKRAKFVRVDRSLPGLAVAEAAFLRLHRAKQINGPVAPRMNATQKRTSSKREGKSGDTANSVWSLVGSNATQIFGETVAHGAEVTKVEAKWSGRRASNPLPRPWQGRALPSELLPPGQRKDHTLGRLTPIR